LIRKGEKEEVDAAYKKNFKFENYYSIDASEIFLRKLKGVSDPEEKRKIIGHTFIEVFEAKVKNWRKRIQKSGSWAGHNIPGPNRKRAALKTSFKIKSHHNLTLPEKMNLKIIEPLKEFYKDDVRKLGKQLGIPDELLNRHPFPGPGLAIRIIGDITSEN